MTTMNEYSNPLPATANSAHSLTASTIKVLVVDNHKVTLNALVEGLASEPAITVVGFSSSYQEALLIAQDLIPDVILVDLQLPDAPGPQTAVIALTEACQAKVIVFSADLRSSFVGAVLDVGAKGYLSKSESVAQVADAIRSAVYQDEITLSESAKSNSPSFTKSEIEILKMLARGMKYDEIADHRKSSPATVRKQCELLVVKLRLASREQLIAWSVTHGYGALELDST